MNTILINMEKAGANVFTRNSLFVILRRMFKEFELKFRTSQFPTPSQNIS